MIHEKFIAGEIEQHLGHLLTSIIYAKMDNLYIGGDNFDKRKAQ